jgi:hypothetical protein
VAAPAPVPVLVHQGLDGGPRFVSTRTWRHIMVWKGMVLMKPTMLVWDMAAQPTIQGGGFLTFPLFTIPAKSGTNNHDSHHVSFRIRNPCRELHVSILCAFPNNTCSASDNFDIDDLFPSMVYSFLCCPLVSRFAVPLKPCIYKCNARLNRSTMIARNPHTPIPSQQ